MYYVEIMPVISSAQGLLVVTSKRNGRAPSARPQPRSISDRTLAGNPGGGVQGQALARQAACVGPRGRAGPGWAIRGELPASREPTVPRCGTDRAPSARAPGGRVFGVRVPGAATTSRRVPPRGQGPGRGRGGPRKGSLRAAAGSGPAPPRGTEAETARGPRRGRFRRVRPAGLSPPPRPPPPRGRGRAEPPPGGRGGFRGGLGTPPGPARTGRGVRQPWCGPGGTLTTTLPAAPSPGFGEGGRGERQGAKLLLWGSVLSVLGARGGRGTVLLGPLDPVRSSAGSLPPGCPSWGPSSGCLGGGERRGRGGARGAETGGVKKKDCDSRAFGTSPTSARHPSRRAFRPFNTRGGPWSPPSGVECSAPRTADLLLLPAAAKRR